jgi:hypothetical protein
MNPGVDTTHPADITTSSVRRVGAFAALVAATLSSEGCAVAPQRATFVPLNPPATAPVAPISPTLREAQKAFDIAEKMGLEHTIYVDSIGQQHSSMKGMREMSLGDGPQTRRSFFDNFDATFDYHGTAKTFKMGAFTDWHDAQARELKNRSDVQRMLKIPGSGLLYSVEGIAFFVYPSGEHVQVTRLDPVQPFFPGETPR